MFWARIQKLCKTTFWRLQRPDIRSRPKNNSRATLLRRSDNGFGPGARYCSKRLSGGFKNKIFGPDPKIVRAPYFWAVLAMVLGQELEDKGHRSDRVPRRDPKNTFSPAHFWGMSLAKSQFWVCKHYRSNRALRKAPKKTSSHRALWKGSKNTFSPDHFCRMYVTKSQFRAC